MDPGWALSLLARFNLCKIDCRVQVYFELEEKQHASQKQRLALGSDAIESRKTHSLPLHCLGAKRSKEEREEPQTMTIVDNVTPRTWKYLDSLAVCDCVNEARKAASGFALPRGNFAGRVVSGSWWKGGTFWRTNDDSIVDPQ